MLSNLEYQIEFKRFRKRFKTAVPCIMSIHDGCANQPINSHTISRASLKIIAKNGHVITPLMVPTENQSVPATRFLLKGVRYASSFPGFCHKHDSEIFKPIDTPNLEATEANIKLLYMRCLSHELFKKYQNYEFQKYLIAKNLVTNSKHLSALMNGTLLGAQIILNQLSDINSGKSSLSYVAFKFDGILPFAFLGAYGFELERWEIINGPIYHLDKNDSRKFANSMVSVIPTITGSYFILATQKKNRPEFEIALNRFARGSSSVIEYIFQFGIDKMENLFFRPSWFLSQPIILRKQIENRFQDTMATYELDNDRPFKSMHLGEITKHALFTNSLKAKKWHYKNFFA